MRTSLFLAGAALAAAAAGRPDLNGTWQSPDAAETISIHQDEDSIQITETSHDKRSEVRCGTGGQACKIKDGEVSLWYNGPMLVMMETLHGNRVVKKRWKASDDGKTLHLEVIHIQPAGGPENFAYSRRNGS